MTIDLPLREPRTQRKSGGTLDPALCYRALLARDVRFDGRFFTAVRTTGIYCRPVCPTPPPKPENCTWYRSAAAAQAAGFRPCLRCRPELAPGPGWDGADAIVRRTISLIREGVATEERLDVPTLAASVGTAERTLRRLFRRHVGASPKQVLLAQRTLFAKSLVVDSSLSMAEIAFASGHGSIRRFNAAFREMFGCPPNELRRGSSPSPTRPAPRSHPVALLRLPYRRPFSWHDLLAFLAPRAIPGVEHVAQSIWRRAIRLGDALGTVEVDDDPLAGTLIAKVELSDLTQLASASGRLTRLFDLDADPARIDPVLAAEPLLAGDVKRRPGVRVPGAWDGFEMAVRGILGQQVSVSAARTLAGRIAARWGTPLPEAADDQAVSYVFPEPAALVNAELESTGVMPARARSIRALAGAMVAHPDLLSPHRPTEESVRHLLDLPGIGPWTAQYIAMRVLRDPDAFPGGDLGLKRALGDPKSTAPGRWRPWRAYAAVRLWTMDRGVRGPDAAPPEGLGLPDGPASIDPPRAGA